MKVRVSLLLVTLAVLGGTPGPAPAVGARAARACFAETGQCVEGRFLDYWQANGGLARNGYPLTPERRELLEDGREYTVQYFERVRLEYHPENAPPYDVLLGQFGRRVGVAPTLATQPPAPSREGEGGSVYFPQTGHNVSARFFAYWQANGGLAQFGLPLGEEQEGAYGGNLGGVQLFERARFEYHPGNPAPYDVLLGQLGRDILDQVELLRRDPELFAAYTTTAAVWQLGPALGPAATAPGATLAFERGRMVASGRAGVLDGTARRPILVLAGDARAGRYLAPGSPYFPDPWADGQPVGGGPGPRPGLYEPGRGFGAVWRGYTPEGALPIAGVRDALGYATAPEAETATITVQPFQRGLIVRSAAPAGSAIDIVYYDIRPSGSVIGGRYERFVPGTAR